MPGSLRLVPAWAQIIEAATDRYGTSACQDPAPVLRPLVVALDVNETLTDLEPLSARLERCGAPGHLLRTWFAATLRDGTALTLSGGYAGFSEVGQSALTTLLGGVPSLDRAPADAAEYVLAGLPELPLHPDVAPGLTALREAGFRLIALTNGAAKSARAVLEAGGVARHLEHILSIDDVGRWKPAPEVYRFAAERCGVPPETIMLAAVHPWDLDGARRAGLRAAWINRANLPYPAVMTAPDVHARGFVELAERLSALE